MLEQLVPLRCYGIYTVPNYRIINTFILDIILEIRQEDPHGPSHLKEGNQEVQRSSSRR